MGWLLYAAGFLVAWSVAWFWLASSVERDRLNAMRPGAILDGYYEAKRRKAIKRGEV